MDARMVYLYKDKKLKISMEERRGMKSDMKRKDIVNFYIPPDFLPIWEEFKKLTEQEGSYSKVLRALVEAYVTVRQGEKQKTEKEGRAL